MAQLMLRLAYGIGGAMKIMLAAGPHPKTLVGTTSFAARHSGYDRYCRLRDSYAR